MNEEKLEIRFISSVVAHFFSSSSSFGLSSPCYLGDDVTIESIDIDICSIKYEMNNQTAEWTNWTRWKKLEAAQAAHFDLLFLHFLGAILFAF